MITVSLVNAPPGAALWLPVFRDGEFPDATNNFQGVGGGGVTYFPDQNIGLDEGWAINLSGILFFRVDILNAQNQRIDQTFFAGYVIEDGRHYIYDWIWKWLYPATRETKFFIRIAEGRTPAEITTSAQGKEVYGSYRLVMETRNAPAWVLSIVSNMVNALRSPLRVLKVEVSGAKVSGRRLVIDMGGHTPVALIIGVVLVAAAALAITFWVVSWRILQEVTGALGTYLEIKQTELQRARTVLESQRVTQDTVQAILDSPDLSPAAKETAVREVLVVGQEAAAAIAAGSKFDGSFLDIDRGINWEGLIRGALIGGGLILGAAVLIPAMTKGK